MNEQLQKALADILTMLSESAKAIGEGAQTEIPLLVQEYLRWGVASAALMLVFWLALGGALHFAALKIRRKEVERWAYKPSGYTSGITSTAHDMKVVFGYFVLPIVGSACALFGGVANIYTILKITVAPSVYLLETVVAALR